MCAQSHALGTRTRFQLQILTIIVISGIVYFREIIGEPQMYDENPQISIKLISIDFMILARNTIMDCGLYFCILSALLVVIYIFVKITICVQ